MGTPLLVGGNPRLVKEGPRVHLPSGEFEIVVDGQLDSVMFIHYEKKEMTGDGTYGIPALLQISTGPYIRSINGPCIAKIIIDKAGTEKHISVSAERINRGASKS